MNNQMKKNQESIHVTQNFDISSSSDTKNNINVMENKNTKNNNNIYVNL